VGDLRDKIEAKREQRVENFVRENLTYTIQNDQATVLPEVHVNIQNDRAGVGLTAQNPPVSVKNMITQIEGENFCLRCNSKRCDHCEELDYECDSDEEALLEAQAFAEGEEGVESMCE
jgi:hypothetical protein